ncbi:MAG TPA: CDP-glycerol glycerophosphotransferase family protein [Candidatus Limnocylindria bacterium]|nr:CDP-glycerol glycerophosphotransferase family protein [Candidatus Limnocylindria bacterium]
MRVGPLARLRTGVSYVLGRFGRRDPGTWVFGNQKGFRDNPRYLAEHVAHHHPDVEVWWIARREGEAAAARDAGLRAALRGTQEAAGVQRRAAAAFLSNGFQDLQPEHLGGAFVVDLRHGKGLKRVLLDMDDKRPTSWWRTPLAALQAWWIRRRLGRISLIVAPGEMARQMYLSAYGTDPSRVQILGSPRFDVIEGGDAFERASGGDLRARLGVHGDDYVVLWLPTWREAGDAAWLPRLDAQTLDGCLDGTRIVLLAKPHPFSDEAVYRERLPEGPRLRLLPEADVDANCLLRVADALVTDFSSAAFDFALLDRPLHFFVPDIDDYRGGKGLYEPLDTISGGSHHTDWPSLLAAVRDAAAGTDATGLANARRTLARGGLNAEPGSSERIYRVVASSIGLGPADD